MTEPEELCKRFPLTRFDQIRLSTAPPYLVKVLIPRSGLVVIWEPVKSGKSFWTFDLAAHVALGWPYMDRKVKKGTVVYLVLEGEHGIGARVEAFRQRLGPRAVYELLTEIGEQRLCRTYLEQRVKRYSEIDPDDLAALDGDTFPCPSLCTSWCRER